MTTGPVVVHTTNPAELSGLGVLALIELLGAGTRAPTRDDMAAAKAAAATLDDYWTAIDHVTMAVSRHRTAARAAGRRRLDEGWGPGVQLALFEGVGA